MTHVTNRLQAFIDNELPPAQMAAVREHCAGCDECGHALMGLQQLWRQVDAGGAPPLRSSLWPELQKQIAVRPDSDNRWAGSFAAAAAVAAGLILGVWMGRFAAPLGNGIDLNEQIAGTTLIEDGAYYVEDAMPTLDQLWLAAVDLEGESGS